MIESTENEDREGDDVVLAATRVMRRPQDLESRFWLTPVPEDDDAPCDVHMVAVPWATKLREVWRHVVTLDREHDLVYENRTLRRSGILHPALSLLDRSGLEVTRLCVTTSIVDTFTARMASRRTKTAFVVDDAEWSLKQRAQDFRRWLDGKQRDVSFDALYADIIRDASVRGDGWIYIDDSEYDVCAERVHRSELLVDPYEARQGMAAIRTMYRVREVSRDALIALFPDREADIMAAPDATQRDHDRLAADWLADESVLGQRDVVTFTEAWHLPHKDGDAEEEGEDCGGRLFRGLENTTLYYGAWETPRLPFARLPRHKSQRGFHSRGDVEQLKPIQRHIDKMVTDIAQNIEVTGKAMFIAPPGIEPAELTGTRPIFVTVPGGAGNGAVQVYHPPPVGPATMSLLEWHITQAHNLTGAAQWFAQGRSPLGNGASGVALDTAEDQLSARHAVFEQQCATFCVEASQAFIDAARRVAKRCERDKDGGRKMKPAAWLDKGTLRTFQFEDVTLDGSEYRLQAEPISAIPSTRGGKLAWISEMIGKGVIPSEQAATLYDEPDVAHANRITLAAMKNVERMMEELGRPDLYEIPPTPEEWHDLALCATYAKAYYNRAQAERAPEEVQVRYREFGDAAIALQAKAVPASPMPDPAGAAMPDPAAMPMGAGPPPMDPMGTPPLPMPPPFNA